VDNYEVSEYLMSNVTWYTVAGYQVRNNHKRIYCKDGYNFSVQARSGAYCSPREDFGPWYEVEVGYPSAVEDTLMPYVDDDSKPLNTVYGYVPIDIVEEIVARHGGIDHAKMEEA
jgi:hypothetical protein